MDRQEMKESEKISVISELETFLKKLKSYRRYLDPDRFLTDTQERYRDDLREELVRKSGALKGIIFEITNKPPLMKGVDVFWQEALGKHFDLTTQQNALPWCIDATTEAIGKLETTPLAELEAQALKKTKVPSSLFDRMQFHQRIITASKSLFESGHYSQAIFEAFKAVNNFVKEKTGLPLDGKTLMAKVFDENATIIKLNEMLTESDKDEQEGFKFLFMGAMVGIRNPKAHDNVVQTDPYRTLEYLSFASLLMKRIEEGKVVKLQKRV
jgi:uncharacterized protein (TIGR02391 family)